MPGCQPGWCLHLNLRHLHFLLSLMLGPYKKSQLLLSAVQQRMTGELRLSARQSLLFYLWRRFPIQHGISCRPSLAEGQATSCCIRWIKWEKSFYYLRSLIISFFLVATWSQNPCSLGCSTEAWRDTGRVWPFYWSIIFSPLCFFNYIMWNLSVFC